MGSLVSSPRWGGASKRFACIFNSSTRNEKVADHWVLRTANRQMAWSAERQQSYLSSWTCPAVWCSWEQLLFKIFIKTLSKKKKHLHSASNEKNVMKWWLPYKKNIPRSGKNFQKWRPRPIISVTLQFLHQSSSTFLCKQLPKEQESMRKLVSNYSIIKSQVLKVKCEVPQCSVFGPLLFIPLFVYSRFHKH